MDAWPQKHLGKRAISREKTDEGYDEEVDGDQVAYIDEEGWLYADEETINAIDEQLAEGNEEFAKVLTTYVEARHALAKARIAQGFYPVVVPREPPPLRPTWGTSDRPEERPRATPICISCG